MTYSVSFHGVTKIFFVSGVVFPCPNYLTFSLFLSIYQQGQMGGNLCDLSMNFFEALPLVSFNAQAHSQTSSRHPIFIRRAFCWFTISLLKRRLFIRLLKRWSLVARYTELRRVGIRCLREFLRRFQHGEGLRRRTSSFLFHSRIMTFNKQISAVKRSHRLLIWIKCQIGLEKTWIIYWLFYMRLLGGWTRCWPWAKLLQNCTFFGLIHRIYL